MLLLFILPFLLFTIFILCLPMAKTDFDKQISDQEQELFLSNYKKD